MYEEQKGHRLLGGLFCRGRVLLCDALHVDQFCDQVFIRGISQFGFLAALDVLLCPKGVIVVEMQEQVWHAG